MPVTSVPAVEAGPINGPLDPVTEAVLGEIPDRPKPSTEKTTPAALEAEEQPAPEKKGKGLWIAGAALGLVALVVGGARAARGASPAAPTTPPPAAPAAPAAPIPTARTGGTVIG
ncbi:hypothetical protein V3W47_18960 [Deinococcus sp. YIM 134068]|uniref:hypothetical protein n=1 Tax=Deinococcus lichenicola TaxID=3118910 RepID=UPI002F957A27